jgi:hypothetical protein
MGTTVSRNPLMWCFLPRVGVETAFLCQQMTEILQAQVRYFSLTDIVSKSKLTDSLWYQRKFHSEPAVTQKRTLWPCVVAVSLEEMSISMNSAVDLSVSVGPACWVLGRHFLSQSKAVFMLPISEWIISWGLKTICKMYVIFIKSLSIAYRKNCWSLKFRHSWGMCSANHPLLQSIWHRWHFCYKQNFKTSKI